MQKVRYTARILLFNEDGTILLQQVRSDLAAKNPESTVKQSYWITPGGGLEEGETPEQAVRRELFEETGIQDAHVMIPHVWYEEAELVYKGELTLFKEYFFVAHTAQSNLVTHNYTPEEQRMIIGQTWWSLDHLTKSTETFFPEHLAALVRQYQKR